MFLFNEDRVSIWDDKEVLERDLGDGCTTLCVHLMPLICTLWFRTLAQCNSASKLKGLQL